MLDGSDRAAIEHPKESVLRNLDMDLSHTLVVIADSGGISAAANRLGRTQSAVSLQIKRLEEAIGQSLLERRQGRVVGSTADGRLRQIQLGQIDSPVQTDGPQASSTGQTVQPCE